MTWRQFVLLVVIALSVSLGLVMCTKAAERCGDASWYGPKHHGRLMANGKPFNMHAMTAAMWDVPLGSKFRVTRGSKSVVVTITDRGPARRLNRVIDLSRAAAAKLGMIDAGVAKVCLERL